MEIVQRSPKICSLCDDDDEYTVVYSTVKSYATHLRSSDHLDKLKGTKNAFFENFQEEKLSVLIKREYHRSCFCF